MCVCVCVCETEADIETTKNLISRFPFSADLMVRTVYHPNSWPLRMSVFDNKVCLGKRQLDRSFFFLSSLFFPLSCFLCFFLIGSPLFLFIPGPNAHGQGQCCLRIRHCRPLLHGGRCNCPPAPFTRDPLGRLSCRSRYGRLHALSMVVLQLSPRA